eukprot:343011-Pyramimonas_sp.AAC.2
MAKMRLLTVLLDLRTIRLTFWKRPREPGRNADFARAKEDEVLLGLEKRLVREEHARGRGTGPRLNCETARKAVRRVC